MTSGRNLMTAAGARSLLRFSTAGRRWLLNLGSKSIAFFKTNLVLRGGAVLLFASPVHASAYDEVLKLCKLEGVEKFSLPSLVGKAVLMRPDPAQSTAGCGWVCFDLLKSGVGSVIEQVAEEPHYRRIATGPGNWRFWLSTYDDSKCSNFIRWTSKNFPNGRRPRGLEDKCIASEPVTRPSADFELGHRAQQIKVDEYFVVIQKIWLSDSTTQEALATQTLVSYGKVDAKGNRIGDSCRMSNDNRSILGAILKERTGIMSK